MKYTLAALKVNAIIIAHIAMFTLMSIILDKAFGLKTQEVWMSEGMGSIILIVYFIAFAGTMINESEDFQRWKEEQPN